MRKPKEKIKLDTKLAYLGQYGESDAPEDIGEFETLEQVEQKYAKSIGMLMISFSELEDTVDRDLATAINERTYEPGYRIIKFLEFREKIDLLKDDYSAYIKYVFEGSQQIKFLAELKILYAKLVELSEFRNKIAHSNWSSLDKAGFVRYRSVENKAEAGMSFQKVKMTPAIIIKFTRQNSAVSNRLGNFREKLWDANNRQEAKRYKQQQAKKK